ncbi:enoyl-CoA hydratase/isomerase family protein, partial [Escherichia fergusonii]|uniref:enoyl-CoA hydratase/isomerase family protein n=1 Tax=Escherichia fergusonii TaxID=564 RepID=UPI001CBF2A17
DCHLTTEALAAIVQRLRDGNWGSAEQIAACFTEAASAPDDAKAIIAPHREAIDACFSQSSVQGIFADLAGSTDAEWA